MQRSHNPRNNMEEEKPLTSQSHSSNSCSPSFKGDDLNNKVSHLPRLKIKPTFATQTLQLQQVRANVGNIMSSKPRDTGRETTAKSNKYSHRNL